MGNVSEQSFILSLLQLLFGQTGALGTVLIGVSAYLGYLYNQERSDHKETRRIMQQAADKRTELFEAYITNISSIKQSIDLLAAKKG